MNLSVKIECDSPEVSARELLRGHSLEMTAKDAARLEEAAEAIPRGTQISVTFLPNEDFAARRAAVAAVRRLGFEPMPHLSARRLASEYELESYLAALAEESAIDRVFVVAGDPPRPLGPYEDALAIINSGLLARYGVKRVGISGYPEGHPDIPSEKLWAALEDKRMALAGFGQDFEIVTQFGFDAEPFLAWIEQVRMLGIAAPVRIGLPGPASVKALLRFAARCGVGTSAKVLGKYGVSITRLLGSAGPDRLLAELAEGLRTGLHGQVLAHFYPFGGLDATARWIRDFREA